MRTDKHGYAQLLFLKTKTKEHVLTSDGKTLIYKPTGFVKKDPLFGNKYQYKLEEIHK